MELPSRKGALPYVYTVGFLLALILTIYAFALSY